MAIIMNLLEIIPGLDAIPVWFLWTLGMVTIVGMVRMEDKGEKPSIIGGFLEGFALAETLNPVALPIAIGTTGLNRARRFVKRRAGVGQADWIKQNEETDNTDTTMSNLDRIQQIKNKYQNKTSTFEKKSENNVLDLKKNINAGVGK